MIERRITEIRKICKVIGRQFNIFRDDLEDFTQDVLIRMLGKPDVPNNYVYRVAERVAIDRVRDSRRGPKIHSFDAIPEFAAPDQFAELHQAWEVEDVLGSLPREDARVLSLASMMPLRDAAKAAGYSYGWTRKRCMMARRRLAS